MTLRPCSSLPPWRPPPNVAGQLIVLRLQPKVSSQHSDKALAPLGPSSQSLPRPLGEVLGRSPFGEASLVSVKIGFRQEPLVL